MLKKGKIKLIPEKTDPAKEVRNLMRRVETLESQ